MPCLSHVSHGTENEGQCGRIYRFDCTEIQHIDTTFELRLQFPQQSSNAVDGHRTVYPATMIFTRDHEPGCFAGLTASLDSCLESVSIRPSIPFFRIVLEKEER